MSDLAARKETDGFCLIYFSHVLENIVDLDGTMALVREHLRDGGWLVIETPNIRFPPSYSIFHPNCFSPRSLGLLLRRHGLQVARLSPSGRPATRLSPRYLTAVAQKSEEHAGAEALKGGAPSTDGLVMKTGHLWYRLASRPPLRLLDRWLTARAYPTTPEQRRALADIEALAERQNQDATD
ncbi:MAG: hypothetical protein QF578_08695, partial [Alphaproteobacteria bacterium]|jgi:hypothetical protein|nr:hypothetical protein [Alphaproteobacteria bacterium]